MKFSVWWLNEIKKNQAKKERFYDRQPEKNDKTNKQQRFLTLKKIQNLDFSSFFTRFSQFVFYKNKKFSIRSSSSSTLASLNEHKGFI